MIVKRLIEYNRDSYLKKIIGESMYRLKSEDA